MRSISLNNDDSFVFHFYETYLEISEKKKQKISYDEIAFCKFKEGKPQILGTIFITIVSLLTLFLRDIKVYKTYGQLIIGLKDDNRFEYKIDKTYDKDKLINVKNLITKKAKL
ncbi:hypothetical protein [Polaribacter ponticola]|uniref:Uncharacterized protein n=1 Tax=Polaribacter ponticola TaxID=2978475 RepID=A0ABT5SB64_9FLAO|nr:hypothetical protein [Polaribacter sp. MSW5]MDD7915354.1 hypothetical protein [Polaribacter sp. MSW5]